MDSASGPLGTPGSRSSADLQHAIELLTAAEQVANLGSWEWLPPTESQRWSANLYQLLGFDPADPVPSRESFMGRVVAEDRDRAIRYVTSVRGLADPPPIELRFVHPELGVRDLRFTQATCELGGDRPNRMVGVVQDVTYARSRTQQIATLLAVSDTLADWDRLAHGVVQLLSEIGRTLEFRSGTFWLPQEGVLLPVAGWSEPAPELAALTAATETLRCPPGTALPGRVWESRRPGLLSDVADDELPRRRVAAVDAGLRGAVAFPALHTGEVIAVFEFYHDQEAGAIERLLPTMVAIGSEIGEFFSRRGAELGRQRLTERQLRVLTLAAAGKATPQIAAELGISASTVRTHFDHSYEKLGVVDRAAAVARALRLGLIK